MALYGPDLSERFDALAARDGTDLVREPAQWVPKHLIEAEAFRVDRSRSLRAKRRSGAPRNDSRPKPPSVEAGDVAVTIPKLRAGSIFPSLLEPSPRIDQATLPQQHPNARLDDEAS